MNLSSDELAIYHEQGLVKPDFRFDAAMRTHLLKLAQRTLDAVPEQRPESINCPHIEDWAGLPAELSQQWLDIAGQVEDGKVKIWWLSQVESRYLPCEV